MKEQRGLGFKQVFSSLIAGAVGVQSNADCQRDFAQGRLIHYIIGGLIFTAGFVGSIVLLVNWLMQSA